jgi:hypothetical protein
MYLDRRLLIGAGCTGIAVRLIRPSRSSLDSLVSSLLSRPVSHDVVRHSASIHPSIHRLSAQDEASITAVYSPDWIGLPSENPYFLYIPSPPYIPSPTEYSVRTREEGNDNPHSPGPLAPLGIAYVPSPIIRPSQLHFNSTEDLSGCPRGIDIDILPSRQSRGHAEVAQTRHQVIRHFTARMMASWVLLCWG